MIPFFCVNRMVRTAAFFGLLAVALGAFGAHSLREVLQHKGTTMIWQTAVNYQAVHALGLLWLGGWEGARSRLGRMVFICWIVGIVIFSGSLYLLALTGQKWLGALTPFGGIGFLLGWGTLLFTRYRP